MTEAVKQEKGVIKYTANNEEIKLSPSMVKQYLTTNPEVTDQEVVMFMNQAKAQHLNPFLNEIYLVKYKGNPAQIIVSKEAFMKRANANPHFRGLKAGIVVQRGDQLVYMDGALSLPSDTLIGAWAEVLRDDRDVNLRVELPLMEYAKTRFNKYKNRTELMSTWKTMPKTMIRKTAEVNALREAFPESLNAMYTQDDVDLDEKSNPKDVQGSEQESKPKNTVNELLKHSYHKQDDNPDNPKPVQSNDEKKAEADYQKANNTVNDLLSKQNEAGEKMENNEEKEVSENDAQGSLFK